MKSRFIWRAIFALVIIAGLTVGGIALYRMGFAQGAMTNITFPEGSDFPVMPYGHMPLGWHAGPRIGLLGIFPLLCFGSFFFLALICGFGFMARKRAWLHHYYGSGAYPEHWKHHRPPFWGWDKPPWAQEQPQSDSDASPAETDESEG